MGPARLSPAVSLSLLSRGPIMANGGGITASLTELDPPRITEDSAINDAAVEAAPRGGRSVCVRARLRTSTRPYEGADLGAVCEK